MEIDSQRYRQSTNQLVLIVLLGVIVAGLSVLMTVALQGARDMTDDPDLRRVLLRLAWLSLTLMLGAVVLLAWATLRFVRQRRKVEQPERPAGPRTDAWVEAGRRFQLEDADQPDADTGADRDTPDEQAD
ncbi:hypothetical protein LCGC14_0320930 [marine sediment metagenome]|uniref:Uncharacterized protein n=1 Tax=marine sediment metagenome TaxID=412755 RepID=A0A0F9W6D0_9ZZZZ|nr:hypothetical protein [Phycisphaerae bacterium]